MPRSPSHGGMQGRGGRGGGNGEVGVVPATDEHQLHLFCAQPVLRVLIVANSFLFWHEANLLAGCRRPVEAGLVPTVSHSTLSFHTSYAVSESS